MKQVYVVLEFYVDVNGCHFEGVRRVFADYDKASAFRDEINKGRPHEVAFVFHGDYDKK